jgi:hypothetical protein
MNIKDILSDNTMQSPLLLNTDIYSGIYKKTEKIACAVFLITDIQSDTKNNELINDIRRLAKDALIEATSFVSATNGEKAAALVSKSVGGLMSLRALLFVLAAARGVRTDLVDVIAREIDGVVRVLMSLTQRNDSALFESIEHQPGYVLEGKRPTVRPTQVKTSTSNAGIVSEGGRREAILSIIRARGTVSIKDISDSITDCSEKTIQRELMSLIDERLIIREGERRWSKYSLASR